MCHELFRRRSQYTGKPVGVLLRTATELTGVMEDNPFPDAPGNRVVAVFLDDPPPADLLNGLKGQNHEVVVPGKREIYFHYENGIGTSKLARGRCGRNPSGRRSTAGRATEEGHPSPQQFHQPRMAGIEFGKVRGLAAEPTEILAQEAGVFADAAFEIRVHRHRGDGDI
ncbi:MAG: DUF1697 domain-containing protein, partial [Verrucomicrobiae bacterium]|nr:DUF1697 domain-containing protein [Verrucomicrobiae bacterium]